MDQTMVNMLMSALNVDPQQMQHMLNDANQLTNGGQLSPEAVVKQRLQSGQMSQEAFNAYAQQASQICQMIGRK